MRASSRPNKTNAPAGRAAGALSSPAHVALDDDVKSELARIAICASPFGTLEIELVHEVFSERAAIREYLGGHPRKVAEHLAIVDTCEMLGVRYTAAP